MTKANHILLFFILSLSFFGCRHSASRFDELQAERCLIEDSIASGNEEYALRETERQMSSTADSTAYYLWLATRNKVFYSKMLSDSMHLAEQRIGNYLRRNTAKQDRATDQLRAEWYLAKGVYQISFLGRPDSGLVNNQKAAAILRKYKENPGQLLTAITNVADCYRQLGKLDYSADVYLQALALADSIKADSKPRIEVELGISTAYSFMGDYENGNRWWNRVEAEIDSMTYEDKAIFYNNRGNDLYFQQRYREAMPYFRKAAELTKGDARMEWQYYTALYNMGEIYVCIGKSVEARRMLDEADAFFRKVDYGMGHYYAVTSYIGLALLDGKPQEAQRLVKENPTPEHMIPIAVMHRLQQEEYLMTAVGNYLEAYTIRKKVDDIKDSVQTENMRMRMNVNLLRFRHDKQLTEKQHEIDHQRMVGITAWALCAVALLAVAILAALIFLQRKRNQLQKLAERQRFIKLRMENARNRISPHFVYNALNHELLAQLKGREVNLSALTQLLRRGIMQANNLETTLKEEMEFVNYYVEIEGQQMGSDFSYAVDIEPLLDMSIVRLPAMSVQIFVENAIKHGLRAMSPREGKLRQLRIRISRSGGSTLVEVIDNGLGFTPGKSDSTHTGMRIVKQTIQILNDRNRQHISFGIENCNLLESGHTGCRSWIRIPDEYDYTL